MHGVVHSIHCETVETSIQVLISPCQAMPALGWTTKQIIGTTGKHFVRPRHVNILPFAGCHVPPKLMNFTLFPQPLQILTQDLVYQADSGSQRNTRFNITTTCHITASYLEGSTRNTRVHTDRLKALPRIGDFSGYSKHTVCNVQYSTSGTWALVEKVSTSTTGTCMLTVVR